MSKITRYTGRTSVAVMKYDMLASKIAHRTFDMGLVYIPAGCHATLLVSKIDTICYVVFENKNDLQLINILSMHT